MKKQEQHEEIITLNELKKRKLLLDYYARKPHGRIEIAVNGDRKFILENATAETRGSHVFLRQNDSQLILKESAKSFARKLIVPLLGILSAIVSQFVYFQISPNKNDEISTQLENINRIKTILPEITKYIQQQETELKEKRRIVENLRKEESEISLANSVSRDQFEAMIKVQSQQATFDKWVERAFSFIIGAIASYLASIVYGRLHSPKST